MGISAFPASPKATFALIRKLDHAFSSLLKGEDSITGEILPGFAGGKRAGLTKTDISDAKDWWITRECWWWMSWVQKSKTMLMMRVLWRRILMEKRALGETQEMESGRWRLQRSMR